MTINKSEELRTYLQKNTENLDIINNPKEAADYIRSRSLGPDEFRQEVFGICAFNIRMCPIMCKVLFRGSVNSVNIDYKIFFSVIFQSKVTVSRLIIFHTRPSGKSDPSEEDIIFSERMVQKCKMLDLVCLDHIIFSTDNHYSIANEHCNIF